MNIVKRLEVLKKETASAELKKSLHSILEMYNRGEISNESILESVTNSTISKYKSDKAVQRFYLYENNVKGINNLGLKPLLFKFKNTAIYENDMLLQSNINRAITLLENNPEYKVAQEIAPILKNYTWNNAVRSMITTVSKAMSENKIYIAVAEAIENLENENGSEIIIEKLSRAFALPEYDAKHYLKTSITESEKFMFPVLETLMKAIGSVEGLGLNRITKHTFLGRPIVEKATVVFEDNNKTYRLIGKRLFETSGKGWKPVKALTESFIRKNESKLKLCEAISNFKQENGKLVHENFSIVFKSETIKVNGKLKAIYEGEQVQVQPDTYKVDEDENVVVLEKDGKKYEIAASKFESAKELGIIEESDIEIVDNNGEVINEFTGFEATPDILSMAMDIKNNIGDISIGDDHVCVCVDGKIIEIIKDESGKKCLYISDESMGIDEMVDMDDEMKVQEAVETMGIDVVQEADDISNVGKDTMTDEEKEKLNETIELKESELSQLNFNLERIESLDEGQKTDEIMTFYNEMKGKRDALVEELNQLKLEKDGEIMNGDLESIVEQIYNNFESLRYDDSHKNEMDDLITVSGDVFKLTETVSVIPQIQYSKNENGDTFIESVELLYPENYLIEKAVEGIDTSHPDSLTLMKGVDESQEFGDELKQKVEEAIKKTVVVKKKGKINESILTTESDDEDLIATGIRQHADNFSNPMPGSAGISESVTTDSLISVLHAVYKKQTGKDAESDIENYNDWINGSDSQQVWNLLPKSVESKIKKFDFNDDEEIKKTFSVLNDEELDNFIYAIEKRFSAKINESKLNSSTNYFCTKHGDVMLISYNSGNPEVKSATSTYSAMATKNFMDANGIDKDSIAWIMAKHAFAKATNTPDFKGVKTVVYTNQIPEFTIGTSELIEQQLNEGKMQITEPIILLAINSKSLDDFKKQMQKYKDEKDSYTADLIDALHRLDLPLNPDNDLKLLYDQVKKISKKTNESKGNNLEIILTSNDNSRSKWQGIVTKKTLEKLQKLENFGGFKRFSIDIYDDGLILEPTEITEINDFLKKLGVQKISESHKLVTKFKTAQEWWDADYQQIIKNLDLPESFKIITWKDLPKKIQNQIQDSFNNMNESFNDDAIIIDKPSDIKKYKEFEKLKDYLQSKFKDGVDFAINADGGLTLKSKTTTDKVVSTSMKLLESIEGGLADNKTLEDIAKIHNVDVEELQAQLDLGISVEMEHTNDESLAEEIAKDHLMEDPLYYTKLATIEKTNEDVYERGKSLLISDFEIGDEVTYRGVKGVVTDVNNGIIVVKQQDDKEIKINQGQIQQYGIIKKNQ